MFSAATQMSLYSHEKLFHIQKEQCVYDDSPQQKEQEAGCTDLFCRCYQIPQHHQMLHNQADIEYHTRTCPAGVLPHQSCTWKRNQSRAAATPAATGAEQGGGEPAVIQRRATGRRQAVALCGRIVQGRGIWGGGRNYHSTLPHIKLIKLII